MSTFDDARDSVAQVWEELARQWQMIADHAEADVDETIGALRAVMVSRTVLERIREMRADDHGVRNVILLRAYLARANDGSRFAERRLAVLNTVAAFQQHRRDLP